MVQSIVLDGLIILIIVMISAVGYARGGMRELCTAAGILFGSRLADAWAPRWGAWLSGKVDIAEGSATFMVYVGVLALSAIICGYGASLAFFSRPGPGGRLYGAALGLINGIAFTSFVLDGVRRYLLDGKLPAIVADSHVARAMVDGFGWILLGIAAFVVLATAFGFLIRENEPDESLVPYASSRMAPETAVPRAARMGERSGIQAPTQPPSPAGGAHAEETVRPSAAPLRVREVRHWEDPVETNPRTAFGAGWSQTWPVASPGADVKTPWEAEEARRRLGDQPAAPGSTPSRDSRGTLPPVGPPPSRSDADALSDWLARERKNEPDGRDS